jgi:hypothetical protein
MRTLSDTDRNAELPTAWDAYRFAQRTLRRHNRVKADRSLRHSVHVAATVAHHGGTISAVCAALLHDAADEAKVPMPVIRDQFGDDVARVITDATTGTVRRSEPVSHDIMLFTVADRLDNLQRLRRSSGQLRVTASLDTLVFHVPLARQLNAPSIAAEMTDLACTTLASLDRRFLARRSRAVASKVRPVDLRSVAEMVAALGGGTAIVTSGAVPDWALATGGAATLAVATTILFGRDPRASRRLAEILAARRRD